MYSYYNSLIIIMFAAFLLSFISPSEEYSKKYMRPICGLALLFVLITPLKSLVSDEIDISTVIPKLTEATEQEKYTYKAYALLEYLSSEYEISKAEVTFITDDSQNLAEIQIFICDTDESTKNEIKKSLMEEFGCEIRIYAEGEQ